MFCNLLFTHNLAYHAVPSELWTRTWWSDSFPQQTVSMLYRRTRAYVNLTRFWSNRRSPVTGTRSTGGCIFLLGLPGRGSWDGPKPAAAPPTSCVQAMGASNYQLQPHTPLLRRCSWVGSFSLVCCGSSRWLGVIYTAAVCVCTQTACEWRQLSLINSTLWQAQDGLVKLALAR